MTGIGVSSFGKLSLGYLSIYVKVLPYFDGLISLEPPSICVDTDFNVDFIGVV